MAQILNPANLEVVAEVQRFDADAFPDCVKAARIAGKQWAMLSPAARARALLRLRRPLIDASDSLAATISACTGKTRTDALTTEVMPSALAIGYYAKTGKSFMKPKRIHGGSVMFFNKAATLFHEPWGVVGIISPWNYPFSIPFQELLMCLACGNAVILKVATQAQPVGDAITQLVRAAALPENLVQVLHLDGAVAGPLFLSSGVDKLFFTGSVGVGKELMALASKTLTPLSLELGGNDAMIVCADANLRRAAEGAVWAGMSNCGQSCGGVQRIYVHRSVYTAFSSLLKECVSSLRQGPDRAFDVDVGSLSSQRQLDTVRAQVVKALEQGALPLLSCAEPEVKGWYYPPTVLENVNHSMRIMKEEVFGPVLLCMPFDTEEEALQLANDSELGLTASVWTRNEKTAERIAAVLQAGAITVNDHLMSHGMAETPWGGYKQSALGRSHGLQGLEEASRTKVVVQDWLGHLDRNIWWYPQNKAMYDALKAALRMFFGPGFFKRIGAAGKVLQLYARSLFRKKS